jgi:hypothetical protein
VIRRLGLGLIGVGFILYVVVFAPPFFGGQPWLLNPIVIAVFSMVGIWLLIYSCLVFADGRMQRLPAWAFLGAAIATGILGLIPYLALREPNQAFQGTKDWWLSWLDARSTGVLLAISTSGILGFGIVFGDWNEFARSFQTNGFIHAMTLAVCLFALLFPYPTLLSDDMARRGLMSDSQFFWVVALIPLFGPLLYVCLRPPLLTSKTALHDWGG